ncbi:DinB family protein [Chloroflexota bacterium]
MNLSYLVGQLTTNAGRISSLVEAISEEDARWKPDTESWSILEVINHLYDEERLDFRVRLDIILHNPDQPWPPIDPQGWVLERRYNERALSESLERFLAEREKSLIWLGALDSPDWDQNYKSPFGNISAGDMFAAWVTHDHIHMRQQVELHRAKTEIEASPYKLAYAGDW